MEIRNFIDSGIMETYVLGLATKDEVEKVQFYKKHYPEFNEELAKLEFHMEMLAHNMAIQPPPGVLSKIEQEINEIKLRDEKHVEKFIETEYTTNRDNTKKDPYIEVEASSNQMRIHKAWRYVFAAVFVLGKIFLGFAIYYYLENRQAQEQIKELKTEIQQSKPIR